MAEDNHHDRLTFTDYRTALTTRTTRVSVVASLFGRLPIAMLGISTLLYIQHKSDSFAFAGAVAAVQLVGVSSGSVIQGRLIDRYGPTRPLLISTACFSVTITALVICLEKGSAPVILFVLAGGIGLTEPMVASASRALWTRVLPAGTLRNAAFSYEAISLEVFFVLGPGLAGILVGAPWPGTGLVVGALCMVFGAITFALSPAVRVWQGAVSQHKNLWGPLVSPGMRTLCLATFGFGSVIGFVEVAVPASSIAAGHPSAGGYLLSAWSISSVGFGLLYSLRPWPKSLWLRLPVLLAGFGMLTGLMAIPSSLWGLGLVMFLAGALIAPQSTAHSSTIELVAPSHAAAEAFGWTTTTITLGLALGQSLSGILVEHSGPKSAFLAAAGMAVLVAGLLWLARNTIRSASRPEDLQPKDSVG
jgi:MFS family permease